MKTKAPSWDSCQDTSPAWLVWPSGCTLTHESGGHRLTPGQGTRPICRLDPLWGVQEAADHCFSLIDASI